MRARRLWEAGDRKWQVRRRWAEDVSAVTVRTAHSAALSLPLPWAAVTVLRSQTHPSPWRCKPHLHRLMLVAKLNESTLPSSVNQNQWSTKSCHKVSKCPLFKEHLFSRNHKHLSQPLYKECDYKRQRKGKCTGGRSVLCATASNLWQLKNDSSDKETVHSTSSLTTIVLKVQRLTSKCRRAPTHHKEKARILYTADLTDLKNI